MGKVRPHIADDVEGLTEWVKRKLTNHDPMSVRDQGGGKRSIEYAPGTLNALRYTTSDGKVFELGVREINPDHDARARKKKIAE